MEDRIEISHEKEMGSTLNAFYDGELCIEVAHYVATNNAFIALTKYEAKRLKEYINQLPLD